MLDYAHNEMLIFFCKLFNKKLKAHKKIGIIAGTGD